ncbi:hypothetical protein [Clostridium tyrobutyricum]|nr:hypothetical protein [Clostridium tyrobutyricum]
MIQSNSKDFLSISSCLLFSPFFLSLSVLLPSMNFSAKAVTE